jgi:hypothetical protein
VTPPDKRPRRAGRYHYFAENGQPSQLVDVFQDEEGEAQARFVTVEEEDGDVVIPVDDMAPGRFEGPIG